MPITDSDYDGRSMHSGVVSIIGTVVGAGSSTPTIAATTVVPARDNFITSTSRTSEGLYVLTFRQFPARVLNVHPQIYRASGAFKHIHMVSFSEANRTVTVQVMLADGSGVDDVETTDTVRVTVFGRKELD